MSKQLPGSVQNKLTGTILLISYLCRRYVAPTIIVGYRLLCRLFILIFNTYLFVGSKVFKNIVVCHLLTLAFLAMAGFALLSNQEAKDLAQITNSQKSELVQTKSNLKEYELQIEEIKKLNKEFEELSKAPKLEYKSTPAVEKNLPDKWQAHKEYILKKLDDKQDMSLESQQLRGIIIKAKNTQKEYGFYNKSECHPYLLMAIHYREIGFRLNNGWNGQGMYQNLGNKYPSNSTVNNATAQTKEACEFIKNKAKSFCSSVGKQEDLHSLENVELIGCALAKYNGCMGNHYNNCGYTVKGLSPSQENFTKCGADFTCPMVKEKQIGALTVILALQLDAGAR
jgi:hypothetical protein